VGKLINIDNGGTLTDICIVEGALLWRTKTLTTPFDLSQCLMEGLRKASAVVYGAEDLEALLLDTDHIRYSTTQGTNALVERKGPRLGLLMGSVDDTGGDLAAVRAANPELYDALVADRHADVPLTGDPDRMDVVRAVSDLAAQGANRVVVSLAGAAGAAAEPLVKRALLKAFPPHLLGAVPILYSRELADDADDRRRTWTALFNAFLHPAMERFLYAAEHKLRAARSQRPLLIFGNDGQSARVAKTVAVKTYSSGPRGGADGAVALARHHGIGQLISIDIGGTTSDVAVVTDGVARVHRFGRIEGVAGCFPLADVVSFGAGGSSIIRVVDGAITIGPDSVGSTPGPACFGLGGAAVTITDAFFAGGLLDPAAYFGGAMRIDLDRARAAVTREIAAPLQCGGDAAILAMEAAWADRVAAGIAAEVIPGPDAVLAAFGGAGPLVICQIAERLGITRVLIPRLAAVFSAFGIGFSDIGHDYVLPLIAADAAPATIARLRDLARRGMAAEAIDPAAVVETLELLADVGDTRTILPVTDDKLPDAPPGAALSLRLNARHVLPRPPLAGQFGAPTTPATPSGNRELLVASGRHQVPLYRVEALATETGAAGPAVLEEEFFTCRVDPGWRFATNSQSDIMLTRAGAVP
jgi:N-methylhydantoinase A